MRHNTTLLDERDIESGLYDVLQSVENNYDLNAEYKASLVADSENIMDDIEEALDGNNGSFFYNDNDNKFYLKDKDPLSFEEISTSQKPVCRNVIADLEAFLRGRKLTGAEVKKLNDEYKLRKFNGMYQCRKKTAYKVLCQKYENARLYRSYDDLYYGMMDGRKEWELPWNTAV